MVAGRAGPDGNLEFACGMITGGQTMQMHVM